MTQNQLKYWELRWKQHYEKILAEVKVREQVETVRHNLAVESETARHNRREERIDTQNMIINKQKLELGWAELDEKKRAALVAEALNIDKYKLAVQQELRETKYTQAQIDNMLANRKLAAMDFALSLYKAKHDISANYIKAEAAMFKNGWTKVAAQAVISGVQSLMTSDEANKLMNAMKDDPDFGWIVEAWGPQTPKQVVETDIKHSISEGEWQGPPTKGQNQMKRFENRPDFQPINTETDGLVTGFSQSENGNGTSIQRGSSGAKYYSNHKDAGSTKDPVETKSGSGTSVIYSGGSHYGPGFQN